MVNETAIQPGIEQEVDAKVLPAGQDTVADRNRLSQSIRFCSSPDGVRLAYAVVGEGPVMVKTANWLSHLEYDWNSPVWRHWMTELASR
jgi:pimeloyl-ACP methyl ester carboxylesterase